MSRRAPLIGLLIAVLLAAAFYFAIYSPLQAQEDALAAETAQLESREAELRNQLALLEELGDREVQLRADLSRLEQYIPTSAAQPSLIRMLQLHADAAGVVISSVTLGDPLALEGAPPVGEGALALAEIPITMIVEGGYFQAVDLFRRLEVDLDRAILVDSVTMNESTEGAFPLLSTIWSGRVFALLPLAEALPVPGATPEPGATATATPTPTQGAPS